MTARIVALALMLGVFPAGAVECDLDLCTEGDQCSAGVCIPGEPLDCGFDLCAVGGCVDGQCFAVSKCPPATHPCRTELTCNPANGECEFDPINDGMACDVIGNDCMTGTCNASGDCVENIPVTGGSCNDLNECTTGDTCEQGACVGSMAEDNTPCGDTSNLCVTTQCRGGVCIPVEAVLCMTGFNLCEPEACNPTTGRCETIPVVCLGSECGGTGTCNPTNGQCEFNSPLPDGTACDDFNVCTIDDQCVSGTCTGTGISNPSMAPVASDRSLVVLAAILAIFPAIGLMRRRG